MRNEEQRHVHLAIESPEQVQDFALCDGVERAGGLIGDHQARPVQHGHGDQHALGLPDADLPRIAPQERFVRRQTHELEEAQRFVFPSPRFRSGDVRLPRLLHLRSDAQHRIQRRKRALQYQRDLAAANLPHFLGAQ